MLIETRPKKPANFGADLPPFLRDALAARGVSDAEELRLPLAALVPPTALPDINRAAERLATAVVESKTDLGISGQRWYCCGSSKRTK